MGIVTAILYPSPKAESHQKCKIAGKEERPLSLEKEEERKVGQSCISLAADLAFYRLRRGK